MMLSIRFGRIHGIGLLGVLLGGVLCAQDLEFHTDLEVKVQASGLPATQPQAPGLRLVVRPGVDLTEWRDRLLDNDLDGREAAYVELVRLAPRNMELRRALLGWALDRQEPELAWTARLALREIGRRSTPVMITWVPLLAQFPRTQRVSPDGLASVPRMNVEAKNQESFGGLRNMTLGGGFPLAAGKQLSLAAPRTLHLPAPNHLRSFNLKVQPEGVTLVVTDIHLGGLHERRLYADRTLGLILEAHPLLRSQLPALNSIPTKSFVPAKQLEARVEMQLRIVAGNVVLQGAGGGRPTEVLGVICTPLTAEEAIRRQLGPGVGFLIESRVPGSVADALQLKRGDILVELLGQPLCSLDDITRLMTKHAGERITVKILDHHGIERERSWTPPQAAQRP